MHTIAGCIIRNKQGEYLLVQEKQEKVHGLWNIPAGYADADESDEKAAARETSEEVGLEVKLSDRPIYVYENTDVQKRYVAFEALSYTGDVKIQESELLDANWFQFDAIVGLNQQKLIRDPWIFASLQKAEHAHHRD